MIYVVRTVDYDGGRRGMTWQERYHHSIEGAENSFQQFSAPRIYGNKSEPWKPWTISDRPPDGLIKSVYHPNSMMTVELCRIEPLP